MNFDELEALGRDIMSESLSEPNTGNVDGQSIVVDDDSEDDMDMEIINTYGRIEPPVTVVMEEKKNESMKLSLSRLPAASGAVAPTSSPRLFDSTDKYSDEAVLNEMVATLEAIVPSSDRRLFLLLASLRASTVPVRSNSLQASASPSGGRLSSRGAAKVDLAIRMFGEQKTLRPALDVGSEASLLRDLLLEELKHATRLQTLVHTVIEPLKARGENFATIFEPFEAVASSHFDHLVALAKSMANDWPCVSQLTTQLFQKWIFAIPLYAALAHSLLYMTQQLSHLTNAPATKHIFDCILLDRETHPGLVGKSFASMPISDLLNEPFNHLPKYQYFIESLLCLQSKDLFETPSSEPQSPKNENSEKIEDSEIDSEVMFTNWCQTLAILQQALNYLTKCYQQSDRKANLRKFVERLGNEAPAALRNCDSHKLLGGHDVVVYITDHRRKRRKRGFAVILAECLILARCANSSGESSSHSSSTSNSTQTSSLTGPKSTSSGGKKTSKIDFTRASLPPEQSDLSKSWDDISRTSFGSSSSSHLSTVNPKQAKKEKKEEEKRLKKLEKEAKRKGTFTRSQSIAPPSSSTIPSKGGDTPTGSGSNSTFSEALNNQSSTSGFDRRISVSSPPIDVAAKQTKSSFNSSSIGSKSSNFVNYGSLPSSSPMGTYSGISRTSITTCNLKFMAMLFFDQMALQSDVQISDELDAPVVIVWACDTKFTIEFEQQSHKEDWLRIFVANMSRRVEKKIGPFSRSLPELYCLPPSGVPTLQEKFTLIESFLTTSSLNRGRVELMAPNFFNFLLSPLASLNLDADTIIKSSVPPRHNPKWKSLIKQLRTAWDSIEIPTPFVLPLLCEFLSKMAEPLIPVPMLDIISSQWDEEDCGDVLKIRNFFQALPAFNLYTLAHLCHTLNRLIADKHKHTCPLLANASGPGSLKNSGKLASSPRSGADDKPSSLQNQSISKRRPRASKAVSYATTAPKPSSLVFSPHTTATAPSPSSLPSQSMIEPQPNTSPRSDVEASRKSGNSETKNFSILSSSSETSSPRHTGELKVSSGGDNFETDLNSDWSEGGPKIPISPERTICGSSRISWLLSGALAPSVLRPFKMSAAEPVSVGNYFARLPRLVRLFATLIDHSHFIFASLKELSTNDFIASFDELRNSIQQDLALRTSFSTQKRLSSSDLSSEESVGGSYESSKSNPGSKNGSAETFSGSGPYNTSDRDTTQYSTHNGTSSFVQSSSGSSLPTRKGEKPKDPKRATTLFQFDMTGTITESFSILDFTSLHYALEPPKWRKN